MCLHLFQKIKKYFAYRSVFFQWGDFDPDPDADFKNSGLKHYVVENVKRRITPNHNLF